MIRETDSRDWRDAAACTRVDPEIFYPVNEASGSAAVARAKQVCAGCPVRKVCLADVMAWEDPARRWGVTGGLTAAERAARFTRERARQMPATARPGAVAA